MKISSSTAPINSIWKHTNGNYYVVMFYTNIHSTREDYPLMITYRDTISGYIWTKPYHLW